MQYRLSNFTALLLVLAYPWLLKLFYLGNINQISVTVGYLAFALVLATPVLGIIFAVKQRYQFSSSADQRRSFALLMISTIPSVFCLIGIILYMFNLNSFELPLYYTVVALALIWIKTANTIPAPAKYYSPKLRVAHGITSLLLLVFIGFHLVNHLGANLGGDAHISLMDGFRKYYRHPLVEVLLVGLFSVQLITGWILARTFISQSSDGYRTLQVATGLILMVFISTHIIAVIGLARFYLEIDPNWDWLVYSPGLLKDGWNVRLISHYFVGVIALILHLGLGLRIVLINHGKERLAKILLGLTFITAIVIAIAIMRPLLLAS
ncbi:MAG: hypothetical protein HRT53_17625 [Colwellia sp.]|nr:hypothetical protein [Colwellia sp.]